MAIKLTIKYCPFCGGSASIVSYVGGLYVVTCDYCFAQTGKYRDIEKAVSAWNRRKTDSCNGGETNGESI
jgi:Lar family restriction alleviation protein